MTNQQQVDLYSILEEINNTLGTPAGLDSMLRYYYRQYVSHSEFECREGNPHEESTYRQDD